MAIVLNIKSDEDENVRCARSRVLTDAGYCVFDVDTIKDATVLLSSLTPHLIVLGGHPTGDGLALCQTIKLDPATAHVMILCLSGNGFDVEAMSAPEHADGWLIEPVLPAELLGTVRTLVRLADLERDKRRLMERLQQTERQFVDVTEAAGCGLWDWDVQTGRLQWYGMHERLAGMLPGGFSAKVEMFMDILHPEDRERVWRKLQEMMARRESRFSDEYRFVHADGSVHWMQGTGRFLYDARGIAVRMSGVVQDITERKEAENKLILYRSIIESSTDAIAVIDRDGRYVEQNEAHRTLLGYSDQDLLGHTPTVHTVGEPYERVMAALSTTAHFEGDIVSKRKDGTCVDIEMNAFPVIDDSGAPRYFVGIKRDITARKQAERALRESEERFRTLADNMSQLAWMADAREGLFWLNRRWVDYTGTTLGQMQAAGWESVVRPDYAECVLAGIHQAWESGEAWEDTFPIRSAEGRYRWFLSRAVPIRNQEGVIVRWFGTHTDVTESRQTEEALRQREEQLRIITDAVPSLISYVDREERYQFVNSGYEDLFGLPRHEIVGRSVNELLGATYVDVVPYVRRALAGETVRFESQLVYVGKPHWVLAVYTPDIKEDGTVAGFYVLVTDISERKQQEDELRRWKDELEVRVQERTGELVVSQDRLRALASQLSLTEQRERRRLAGDLHDYLAQLLVVGRMKVAHAGRTVSFTEAGDALLQDLDDLLQQALAYTRTMIAELCPPALHDAGLPSALQWLAERMQQHGLSVEVRSTCEQLPLPEDRAVFLFQSVRELLYNVLKHAGVDRATVSLTVNPHGDLNLLVEDRGKGLDADALSRSVEPGHVGLFSVRERMESMGGCLVLEGRPGGGTRVELRLPAAVSSPT